MKSFWRADSDEGVPVARPKLPAFDQIAPYLRRIDEARWYSNGGPLVQEFQARLAEHCGEGAARVATVANATLGLTLALLASDLPKGTLCMVPSWTFAATGHAILLAGLVPWMVDVSGETWALEADAAREFLTEAPGPVAAVIPVSPFGAPIKMEPWGQFREATGVAVIADSAASFDCVRASEIPQVVSLHATKACGIGEGGFVVSTNESLVEEIQKRANFGFWNSRESTARSFNGKLSEYAAAVGLASLETWAETRADFLRVAVAYGKNLAGAEAIRLQPGFGESWISSTVVVESRGNNADTMTRLLAENGIGSRRWWGGGLHRHRSFQDFPCHRVKQTEVLTDSVVGLPCWRDLPNEQITRICELLRAGR
jgi:dTDP-4-amino-4,6-dideoxygalactose transaminase